MAKTITTITADALDTMAPATRRDVTRAYTALANLEPSAARVRKAAQTVGKLRADGFSIRGVVAVLSLEGDGTLPVGKGTIERLGYVAEALAREWPEVGDSADAILMGLYRIAQIGNAKDVARAAEAACKQTTGDAAFEAVNAVRVALNTAQHKSLTTPPARKPQLPTGEVEPPAEGDGEPQTPAESGQGSESASTPAAASSAASATTLALILELTRRVEAKVFTPDEEITTAFDTLALAFEAATSPAFSEADLDA